MYSERAKILRASADKIKASVQPSSVDRARSLLNTGAGALATIVSAEIQLSAATEALSQTLSGVSELLNSEMPETEKQELTDLLSALISSNPNLEDVQKSVTRFDEMYPVKENIKENTPDIPLGDTAEDVEKEIEANFGSDADGFLVGQHVMQGSALKIVVGPAGRYVQNSTIPHYRLFDQMTREVSPAVAKTLLKPVVVDATVTIPQGFRSVTQFDTKFLGGFGRAAILLDGGEGKLPFVVKSSTMTVTASTGLVLHASRKVS